MTDREFEVATTEYKELSQNIRESWTYITTLIRQHLIIQFLLLGIVGLGGSLPLPGGLGQNAAAPAAPNTPATPEATARKVARYTTLFILVVVGVGLSAGALVQSKRLFENSTAFVRRAAAIEQAMEAKDLRLNMDGVNIMTHPMHIYMVERLSNQSMYQMQYALRNTYLGGFGLWLLMGGVTFAPLLF